MLQTISLIVFQAVSKRFYYLQKYLASDTVFSEVNTLINSCRFIIFQNQ